MKYFAYGANMDPVGMARRCPRARPAGSARLPDHRLTFRRWRAWRTGVAGVERAPGESVWGVLWDIEPHHERALDRYEMVEQGLYTKATVLVEHDGTSVDAMVYLATPEVYKRPSRRYMRLLVRGANAAALPEDYVRRLGRLGFR